MELFVSDEIKCAASKCNHMHECLTWDKEMLCRVTSTVDNTELFVICEHGRECSYQHGLEGRMLCTCPVRLEVYRKYKI